MSNVDLFICYVKIQNNQEVLNLFAPQFQQQQKKDANGMKPTILLKIKTK